jgi:type VI secretion system protein ImpG
LAARSAQDLLDYYKRELAYLRGQGADFARRYPQVAHLLELGPGQSADPHVERLIEAVAFLAARVHLDLDNEFPQISSALLESLYPSLVSPVPSMSVAHFQVDTKQSKKLTSGFEIPRHTALYAKAGGNIQCRFRTCYPLTLWPIEVTEAGFASADAYGFLRHHPGVASVLRLRLETLGEIEFTELDLSSLRLHLHGEWMEVMPVYELLVSSLRGVYIVPAQGEPTKLREGAFQEAGFGADEDVLPRPGHVHPAYQLLQEYFAFPRKFLFFDVQHLDAARGPHRSIDLLFLLDQPRPRGQTIDRDTFRLGCTPIINLFRKTSEPIRIDHRRYEYRLVPDWRDEAFTEIHTIESVTATDREAAGATAVQPFYAFDHAARDESNGPYWLARRDNGHRPDIAGTDMWLSVLDLDFRPQRPDFPVVYANTLCTNRQLAEQVPVGATLIPEIDAASSQITCMYEPTRQVSPPLGGQVQWRLISMLTLNNISLLDPDAGLEALREMLTLYNATDAARANAQIRGIRAMSCASVVGRIGREAWRGFCRGFEITLEFDEGAYVGGSPLMLAAVLNRFFALYTSVNSFTRVVVKRGEEEWKRWEPMTGRQPVL